MLHLLQKLLNQPLKCLKVTTNLTTSRYPKSYQMKKAVGDLQRVVLQLDAQLYWNRLRSAQHRMAYLICTMLEVRYSTFMHLT